MSTLGPIEGESARRSREPLYHVVCHDCRASWLLPAARLGIERIAEIHEDRTGHSTSWDRIGTVEPAEPVEP